MVSSYYHRRVLCLLVIIVILVTATPRKAMMIEGFKINVCSSLHQRQPHRGRAVRPIFTNEQISNGDNINDDDSTNANVSIDSTSSISPRDMDRLTRDFQSQFVDSDILSGATVAIIHGNEIIYRNEFGTHESDTVVSAYSMTKVVTSIACLQLVERGLLSLDDPVSKHLESFVNDSDTDDNGRETMTIRHCLSHTAGLDYTNNIVNPKSEMLESFRWLIAYFTNDLCGYVDRHLSKQPLLFKPGTRYNYADGANVAAAIVERLSGEPFAAYVRNYITDPLGMHDTTFLTTWEQRRRYPRVRWDLEAIRYPITIAQWPFKILARFGMKSLRVALPFKDLSLARWLVRGDMGLKTTGTDWIKLVQMLLARGVIPGGESNNHNNTRILSPSSVDEIGISNLPDGATLISPYALDSAPSTPQGHFGTPIPSGTTYRPGNCFQGQAPGLGVNVILDAKAAGLNPRAVGTCWWMGIASTYFSYQAETGVGCIVLAQEFTCFSRMGVLAYVINAAFEMLDETKSDNSDDEVE